LLIVNNSGHARLGSAAIGVGGLRAPAGSIEWTMDVPVDAAGRQFGGVWKTVFRRVAVVSRRNGLRRRRERDANICTDQGLRQ